MDKYLSERENLHELVSHMKKHERVGWLDFGHLELVPCFKDRVLIMYKVNPDRSPAIQFYVDVVGITINDIFGVMIEVSARNNKVTQWVTAIPAKLFGMNVYASVPTRCEVRWDAHYDGVKVNRSLMYTILVKTANKPVFNNAGNTYLLTPNKFKELFPLVEVEL